MKRLILTILLALSLYSCQWLVLHPAIVTVGEEVGEEVVEDLIEEYEQYEHGKENDYVRGKTLSSTPPMKNIQPNGPKGSI